MGHKQMLPQAGRSGALTREAAGVSDGTGGSEGACTTDGELARSDLDTLQGGGTGYQRRRDKRCGKHEGVCRHQQRRATGQPEPCHPALPAAGSVVLQVCTPTKNQSRNFCIGKREGSHFSPPFMAGRGALRLPATLLVLSCLVIHSEESVHDALPRSPAGAPVSPRQDKLCSCLGDAMERIGRVLRCCSCGVRPSPRPA